MMNPYAILGIKKDASAKQIKKAFRRKARETHPDHGGDHEEFAQVNAAYQILSNSYRKKLYDKSGVTRKEHDITKEAKAFLADCWLQLIQAIVQDPHYVLGRLQVEKRYIKSIIMKNISRLSDIIAEGEMGLTVLHEMPEMIKYRGNGESIYHRLIEDQVLIYKEGIHRHKHRIKVMEKCLELLGEYDEYQIGMKILSWKKQLKESGHQGKWMDMTSF
jgi:curved DNA-binding protein CbpA